MNTSTEALVSEYWYNGLGHRITWHADTSRSGGGAPDGSVNTDDPKVHFVYNERWQQVAAYRQANGSGVDTYPKDQFVHHNAGHGGFGGGSYIDAVLLRDDHEDDWTESADSTMERRVYYCQNWRADVVALLAENGRVLERAWYEPYGTPHGLNPADFSGTSDDTNDHYLVPDGDADADDSFVYLDLFGLSAALSDMTGSSDPGDGEYGRPNGVIDSDDYFYYLDVFVTAATLGRNALSAGHDGATASHGVGNLRNRRGLAGYEWDPHVKRYHGRNRVLYPEVGRWTRRDPMGYVDGMGLYEYGSSSSLRFVDWLGLDATICVGIACALDPPSSPPSLNEGWPDRITEDDFFRCWPGRGVSPGWDVPYSECRQINCALRAAAAAAREGHTPTSPCGLSFYYGFKACCMADQRADPASDQSWQDCIWAGRSAVWGCRNAATPVRPYWYIRRMTRTECNQACSYCVAELIAAGIAAGQLLRAIRLWSREEFLKGVLEAGLVSQLGLGNCRTCMSCIGLPDDKLPFKPPIRLVGTHGLGEAPCCGTLPVAGGMSSWQ